MSTAAAGPAVTAIKPDTMTVVMRPTRLHCCGGIISGKKTAPRKSADQKYLSIVSQGGSQETLEYFSRDIRELPARDNEPKGKARAKSQFPSNYMNDDGAKASDNQELLIRY